MADVRCPYCGARLTGGVRTCFYCGQDPTVNIGRPLTITPEEEQRLDAAFEEYWRSGEDPFRQYPALQEAFNSVNRAENRPVPPNKRRMQPYLMQACVGVNVARMAEHTTTGIYNLLFVLEPWKWTPGIRQILQQRESRRATQAKRFADEGRIRSYRDGMVHLEAWQKVIRYLPLVWLLAAGFVAFTT